MLPCLRVAFHMLTFFLQECRTIKGVKLRDAWVPSLKHIVQKKEALFAGCKKRPFFHLDFD